MDFDRALSTRLVQKIVKRWADYSRLGDLSPHDLRRTAITGTLDSGLSYRQVQMMSKHKDPKMGTRWGYATVASLHPPLCSKLRPRRSPLMSEATGNISPGYSASEVVEVAAATPPLDAAAWLTRPAAGVPYASTSTSLARPASARRTTTRSRQELFYSPRQ